MGQIAFNCQAQPPSFDDSNRTHVRQEPNLAPRAIVCDHDAEGRATLERHLGVSTRPAEKWIMDGPQSVDARLRAAGDGKPRLFLLRDSLVERDRRLEEAKKPCCTEEEMDSYVWREARTGLKEEPLKQDDHGNDALRYMVAHLDLRERWGAV